MAFLFSDNWVETKKIESKKIVCWNCGQKIASNVGYYSKMRNSNYTSNMAIYICHHCNAPSVFDSFGHSVCNVIPGRYIQKLPDELESIYSEARSCLSVKAYTACVMLLRKILMNLAVINGAKEGAKFIEYVDYLCENGYVHRKQKKQADIVRKMGNEANHQIENKTKEEAEQIFRFVEFVLLNNYEFADDEDCNET